MRIYAKLLLAFSSSPGEAQSRWTRRTLKRRIKTDKVLSSIPPPSFLDTDAKSFDEVSIDLLEAPNICWQDFPDLDPEQGGKLPRGSKRARRKRRAVEAFAYVIENTFSKDRGENRLVVDAASGAGNLAIPLAAKFGRVLAIDVNNNALHRLSQRCLQVETLCADLASDIELPPEAAVVCSLHACGSASDLAIQLAVNHQIPFVVSPCCTAKAITRRVGTDFVSSNMVSFQRSGSPVGLQYPRSLWLRCLLSKNDDYILISKAADIGLGPQTTPEQRRHQRIAKLIVECDRLAQVVENENYSVRLLRLRDHESYGKSEILLGAPNHSKAWARWKTLLTKQG